MIKNNVLILGITTLLAASITVIAIGTPVLSNGFNMSAKENETVHTLVVTSGENGNLYCKNPNLSNNLYTYYTISSEGTKFLIYSSKKFQSDMTAGSKITNALSLNAVNHNIQTRNTDSSDYYGRISNLLSITASYNATVEATLYTIYPDDANNPTTGGNNIISETKVDFEQNKSGEFPDRFKIKSNATDMIVNSITLTYSC